MQRWFGFALAGLMTAALLACGGGDPDVGEDVVWKPKDAAAFEELSESLMADFTPLDAGLFAKHASAAAQSTESVLKLNATRIVRLTQKGSLQVSSATELARSEDWGSALKPFAEGKEDACLLVAADARSFGRSLRQLLEGCQSAGIHRIFLMMRAGEDDPVWCEISQPKDAGMQSPGGATEMPKLSVVPTKAGKCELFEGSKLITTSDSIDELTSTGKTHLARESEPMQQVVHFFLPPDQRLDKLGLALAAGPVLNSLAGHLYHARIRNLLVLMRASDAQSFWMPLELSYMSWSETSGRPSVDPVGSLLFKEDYIDSMVGRFPSAQQSRHPILEESMDLLMIDPLKAKALEASDSDQPVLLAFLSDNTSLASAAYFFELTLRFQPVQLVLAAENPERVIPPVPEAPVIEEVEFPKDTEAEKRDRRDSQDDLGPDALPRDAEYVSPGEESDSRKERDRNTDLAETVPAEGERPRQEKADAESKLPKRWHSDEHQTIQANRSQQRDADIAPRIDAALLWLAHHQSPEGYWDGEHFRDHSERIRKMGEACASTKNIEFGERITTDLAEHESLNVGLSALALVAFLSNGHTSKHGEHSGAVKKGLAWLCKQQDYDGCFGVREGDEFIYNHAVATIAVCEAYHLSRVAILKRYTQRAVDFAREAQNPGLAWRYGVKPGDNDTNISGLMVIALACAERAGLMLEYSDCYAGANKWLDLIIFKNDDGYLSAGYRAPGTGCARMKDANHYSQNSSMGLAAVTARLLSGKRTHDDSKEILELASRAESQLPRWRDDDHPTHPEHAIDMSYWFWGTRALFELGGESWTAWRDQLFDHTLLPHQRGYHASDIEAHGDAITTAGTGDDAGCWKLDEHGSWDPVGAWGAAGGRIYSTALNTITLSILHRYPRIADVQAAAAKEDEESSE